MLSYITHKFSVNDNEGKEVRGIVVTLGEVSPFRDPKIEERFAGLCLVAEYGDEFPPGPSTYEIRYLRHSQTKPKALGRHRAPHIIEQ